MCACLDLGLNVKKKYTHAGVSWVLQIMGGSGMDPRVVWLVVVHVNIKSIVQFVFKGQYCLILHENLLSCIPVCF